MNKLFLATTLCIASTTPFICAKTNTSPISSTEKSEIESYFKQSINGNGGVFTNKTIIKPSQIEEATKEVWNLWKDANKASDEEKLGELTTLSAKTASKWELPSDLEPSATMNYYWGHKGTSSEPRPLLIYLHGSGHRDLEWATGLKLAGMFDDAPSAYFIPQIPNMGEWYRWWQKSKQWAWEKLLRQAMLRDDIDPNRIYMFGISEGGYGSQRLASFYGDYLAAAGPMAGGEPLINAPAENLLNTPLTFHTGERDLTFCRNILTTRTGEELDSLKKANNGIGYEHVVELVPNMGHNFDYRMTTPWLVKHTRNANPKSVRWENFEMDGNYRNGFNNIYVDERSNADDKTRTYYTMDIDGNDIDMTVSNVAYEVTESDNRFGFPISIKYNKTYTPATTGKITVYLNDKLIDVNKKVNLKLNGKTVFSGKLKPSVENLVNSCARYFDPERLYPYAITVDVK